MFEAEVKTNFEKVSGYGVISLLLPSIFPVPRPGQFIMVRLYDGTDPLLRRPFSICNFHQTKENSQIDILYRVVGRGTEMMRSLRRGDKVSISRPSGTAFNIPMHVKRICLVAGGVGIAPLVYLARFFHRHHRKGEIFTYVGMKTEKEEKGLCVSELMDISHRFVVATEDGSTGYVGLVTEAFRQDINEIINEETAVYACGPREMIRALASFLIDGRVFCQVSMEERMACGMGACLGCVVALKGREGNVYYGRVCTDGPVFNLRHVIWEERK
ncbi:MAG: dihydroorotate dehydrogenase electron transfer subunit [Syntrophales bacterium]|nr:dihydroorotate dehydrogenase electron transfer subunit [Syntrophales bacterium]